MKHEDESYLDDLLKSPPDTSVDPDRVLSKNDEDSFLMNSADLAELAKQSSEFDENNILDELDSLDNLDELDDFSLDFDEEIDLDNLESFDDLDDDLDDLEYLEDLNKFNEQIAENLLEEIQQEDIINKESSFEEDLMEEFFAPEDIENNMLNESEELTIPDLPNESEELTIPDLPNEPEELAIPDALTESEELIIPDLPEESEELDLLDRMEESKEIEDKDNLNAAGDVKNMIEPDDLEENNPLGEVEDLLDLLADEPEDTDNRLDIGGIGDIGSEDPLEDLLKDSMFSDIDDIGIDDISLGENTNENENIGISDDLLDMVSMSGSSSAEEEPEAEGKKDKKKKGKKKKAAKGKSVWQRLFGNVHDEKSKKPQKQVMLDADGKPIEKIKKTKEEIKKEKEQKKKEQAEAKKEQEAKKAEIKSAKEEQKKQKKEAKKAKVVEEVVEDEGRINRVGAFIVFAFIGAIAVLIVRGTDTFAYSASINKATQDFNEQEYNSAYKEVRGIEIKTKDMEIYDKIITVMFVNKQLNSYNNYYEIGMYPEALDSLLKGLQRYDEYFSLAKELGIKSDLDYVRNQILGELKTNYGMNEASAYSIIESDDQEIYSQKVIKVTESMD